MMEDSPIGLDKWLTATWLLTNCKNGISSYEIARDVKVSQKAAWFMLHRIRLAMQDETFGSKLGGEVEADETFIGGKSRNMQSASVSAVSLAPAAKTRLRSWASWSAAEKFALQSFQPQGNHSGGGPQACRSGRGALHRCAAFLQRTCKRIRSCRSLTMLSNT